MENLDFLKCYYRPSFFRMMIDLPVDLNNLNEITDATFALYFHEYIHFIQDISTIYGLTNISTITYYIHDSAHRISELNDKVFEIPIELINRPSDYGYNNFKLKPHYIGSSINPKRKYISILDYNKATIQWGEKPTELLDIIKVIALDLETQETFDFNLGGNLITEGMAHLCENYVYFEILKQQNLVLPADNYPYLVCQKIAESIYPELASEPLLMVAVYDSCLMTYHPGLSFIRLLEHLKNISFMSNEVEIKLIYSEANNLLKGAHADFETILEHTRSQLKSNFNADEFKGNNEWIDLLFDRIKVFRNEVPEFITDFLQFGNLKENVFFHAFHNLLGSPLVINGEYKGSISLPAQFKEEKFHPGLFWAINQMLWVFTNKQPAPCDLKDHCIKSKEFNPKIIVDERCDTKPWSRCNDKDLCSFATMWRHWALTDYSPKVK